MVSEAPDFVGDDHGAYQYDEDSRTVNMVFCAENHGYCDRYDRGVHYLVHRGRQNSRCDRVLVVLAVLGLLYSAEAEDTTHCGHHLCEPRRHPFA